MEEGANWPNTVTETIFKTTKSILYLIIGCFRRQICNFVGAFVRTRILQKLTSVQPARYYFQKLVLFL